MSNSTFKANRDSLTWILQTQLDATATKGWSESKGTILAPHLVIDEQSVVSKAAGAKDAVTFGDAFANALKNHRHFDRDVTGVAF